MPSAESRRPADGPRQRSFAVATSLSPQMGYLESRIIPPPRIGSQDSELFVQLFMTLRQTLANPFYVLLLMAGVAFSLTACAYGVMTVRGLHRVEASGPGGLLMGWLDEHGFALMLIELGVLAMFCFLAVTTDAYWERRLAQKSEQQPQGDTQ